MIQVSGFNPLLVPSPSVNEPSHRLSAQTLEQSLNTNRQTIERFRNSVEATSPINDFLGMLGRTNVVV